MANEIQIDITLRAEKGFLREELRKQGFRADMAGLVVEKGVQTIGTTHEQVSIGDVSTAGWAAFVNLDAENFIEIGVEVSAAFHPLIKLMPGETAVLRLATNTFFAQADTDPVNLHKFVIEE